MLSARPSELQIPLSQNQSLAVKNRRRIPNFIFRFTNVSLQIDFCFRSVDLNSVWMGQEFWAELQKFKERLQKKWKSTWYWMWEKCKQLFAKEFVKRKNLKKNVWIVKEIQLDRNMCDPNSYCFLSIEFSIHEIGIVENFQGAGNFEVCRPFSSLTFDALL